VDGAFVNVSARPFWLVNTEDAIKVAGLEGKMRVADLVELGDWTSGLTLG
jgi:hypothetical protein